jgi:hypothetical protein
MSELRAGAWPYFGWEVVDPFFTPDAAALNLVKQDVTDPWAGPSIYVKRGRLRPRSGAKWTLHPYDGLMSASVGGSRNTTVALVVAGRVVAGPARRVSYTVCGAASVRVAVRSSRGGIFRLRLSEDDS